MLPVHYRSISAAISNLTLYSPCFSPYFRYYHYYRYSAVAPPARAKGSPKRVPDP